MYRIVVVLAFAILVLELKAQEHTQRNEPQKQHDHHSLKGANRLTLGLGHSHISQGIVDGKTEWLTMPSWSINFDHWVSDKWAVGIQSDIILQTFVIEDKEGVEFERERPLTLVPVTIFKPGKRFSMLGGVGGEFAKGHNFVLTRLGVEYGFHLPGDWEVGAAMVWDNKWNYYNSWGLAFTFSKIWPRKKISGLAD
jgi:hypothetical protein